MWSTEKAGENVFATIVEGNKIKIYKNMQEYKVFDAGFQVEGIHGGRMLGVKSKEFISFYDWET